jgi:acetyltransferase-like isoleucine patch superfamily enzyme
LIFYWNRIHNRSKYNISGGLLWYLKEGIDLFVADNAQIKQPHLVEVGDHVAIDVGVYLATEAIIDYVHI